MPRCCDVPKGPRTRIFTLYTLKLDTIFRKCELPVLHGRPENYWVTALGFAEEVSEKKNPTAEDCEPYVSLIEAGAIQLFTEVMNDPNVILNPKDFEDCGCPGLGTTVSYSLDCSPPFELTSVSPELALDRGRGLYQSVHYHFHRNWLQARLRRHSNARGRGPPWQRMQTTNDVGHYIPCRRSEAISNHKRVKRCDTTS